MISLTYDYNENALRSRGQKGDYILSDLRSLQSIFADIHFKYKGLSLFGEYVNRSTSNGSAVVDATYDLNGQIIDVNETYYTGSALNLQLGYLMKNNWEIAGRFTQVAPEAITMNNNITQYTLGFSRYIVGHNLKIQGDISYTQEANKEDVILFRLQTEFNF